MSYHNICLEQKLGKYCQFSFNKNQFCTHEILYLTPALLNRIDIAFENSIVPDQMASEEAIWSGSTLFVIQFVNLYEQTTSSYLIGW